MKKLLSFILIAISILGFTSCAIDEPAWDDIPTNNKDCDNIEPELASYIKNAYYKTVKDNPVHVAPQDLYIKQYYGNFNGCHVIRIGGHKIPITAAQRPVEISDYTLVFPDGEIIYVYYDGSIYTIKKAYELDIINSEDVYNIGVAIGVEIMNDAAP